MFFSNCHNLSCRGSRIAQGILPALLLAVLTNCSGCRILPCAGCGRHEKAILVFAVDISGSTESQRGEMLDELDLATVRACVDRTPLRVWVFAERPLQVWYGVPHSSADLAEVKAKYMGCGKTKDHTQHVTRPGALLEAVTKEKRLTGSLPLHLFVATDGDAEDYHDLSPFKSAAQSLAKRAGFKIWVLGIDPVNRGRWDSAFAACPSQNVFLAVPSQAQQALTDGLR